MLKFLQQNIVNFIFPNLCLICRALLDRQAICGSCWSNLTFLTGPYCVKCGTKFRIQIEDKLECGACIAHKPSYDMARHAIKFDHNSKHVIHALKYYDQNLLANFFADWLYSHYASEILSYDYITFIPMHKLKRIFRKYNQAQIIAEALADISKKPLLYNVLRKTKFTKSQTGLSASERQKNIKGSIAVGNKMTISGKKIIIIDDVYTTGATVEYCSKLLKKNGAAKVFVLTIAKTTKND